MQDDLNIPWDRNALEALLRTLISGTESGKVDLKSSFDISSELYVGCSRNSQTAPSEV